MILPVAFVEPLLFSLFTLTIAIAGRCQLGCVGAVQMLIAPAEDKNEGNVVGLRGSVVIMANSAKPIDLSEIIGEVAEVPLTLRSDDVIATSSEDKSNAIHSRRQQQPSPIPRQSTTAAFGTLQLVIRRIPQGGMFLTDLQAAGKPQIPSNNNN